MRKFVLLALCALALVACKKENAAGVLPVHIVTGEVSDLTPYTVTLHGQYSIGIGMSDVEFGMIFSDSQYLNESNSRVIRAYGEDNKFLVPIENLETETTYYYRSFIYYREGFNQKKKDYGEVRSFTTPPINAVVTTGSAIAGISYIYAKGSVSIEYKRTHQRFAYMLFGKSPDEVEKKSMNNSVFCSINDDYDDEWTFEASYLDTDGQTCYYRAMIEYNGREYYGEIKSINHIPCAPTEGEIIDMGLSVKWGSCNVGATKPEESGDYFAWGEVASKSEYTTANYLYAGETPEILPLANDAASVNLGESWRMPTFQECRDLIDGENNFLEYGSYNGVYGCLITSKKNGNSLFFPAAGEKVNDHSMSYGLRGCYWTSSFDLVCNLANRFEFGQGSSASVFTANNPSGAPVRGVHN